MTQKQSPQQAALSRLDSLLNITTKAHDRAVLLLDIMLNDAVQYQQLATPDASTPFILTESTIAEFTQLKMELSGLVTYYKSQKEQFESSLNSITERATLAALRNPPKVETVETLRARTEKLALEKTNTESAVVETPPVTPTGESGGLPAVISVSDYNQTPVPVSVQTSTAPLVQTPQENSIQRLFGQNSPLLDIFSPGPWLENGKGTVTIGTSGFKWYKATNPMLRSSADRATLPTGFYSGEDKPDFVVLRMTKHILVWSFDMSVNSMFVYVVGLSDTNPTGIRWFKPSELTASYTRQLVAELLEMVEKYKVGAN